jgi:diguanylate cyclase (GGDEF)-like protein
MQDEITLDKLEENLVFFNKMYDLVRIVDPINKKVLEWKGSLIEDTKEVCYGYWENGKICDNCVSVRAHNSNKSFMKLEQSLISTMLVTAIPIENSNPPVVLELLKNATDSMLIGEGDYNEGHMISNLVSQLNDMVARDSLTGLYNRRFIDDRLPVDIIKSTINDSPLSIIFMDLDNLKLTNDEFGHNTGDLILKEVGSVINGHIRNDIDWAARYGGDEFVICLNNTDNDVAHKVVERIQASIRELQVTIEGNISICLSASMGIHTMYETKLTAEELINQADRKMYQAKNANKIIQE